MASSAPPSSVFAYRDRIVWASATAGFVGGQSERPACVLLVGLEPFDLLTGRRKLRSRALLVAPNLRRAVDTHGAGHYSLTLDPAHRAHRYLRDGVLRGRNWLDLETRLDRGVLAELRRALGGGLDCAQSFAISEQLLAHFCPGAADAPRPDSRVAQVAGWLRQRVPARASMAQLSAMCGLSPGRLSHLFSEELGVSIRSYLRWAKMCRALELLGSHRTVTEVAAEVGFSDAAHFTRVLRSYYSAAPSFAVKPENVRMHRCDCA